jgi:hypothetical protein
MSDVKLDGYCGLYGGACDRYRLSEKARQACGETDVAEETLREIIEAAKSSKSMRDTHGCD